jgi:putative ABC transport system permease protein
VLHVIIRGALARKVRFALAAAAIVLGVGFVSGSIVLAQSVRETYDRLLNEVVSGVDVYVRGPETDRLQGLSDFAPLPRSLATRLTGLPDVAAAQGQVVRLGQLVTVRGTFLDPGRPTYALSWLGSTRLSPFVLVAGRAPAAAGEVALDRATATTDGFTLGSTLRVSIDVASPQPARVVGIVAPREGGDVSDATTVFVDATWAQRVVGIGQSWDLIELKAAHGISAERLRDHVAAVLPDDGSSAITSRQYADAEVQNLDRRSNSVTSILLALSSLAVAVGCAVVFSTFAILVVQRTREIALLRTVGLTRRQVYVAVLAEASVLGLVASAAGAGLAVPVSFALRALVGLAGENVSAAQLDVEPLTLVLAVLAGTVLTTALAMIPAWKASRVLPVAALREASVITARAPTRRLKTASATAAACGVALLIAGFLAPASDRLPLVLPGGGLIALWLFTSLPLLMRLLLRRLGSVAARAGASASVARIDLMHNPRRALGPLIALVAGAGVLSGVSVVATSAHASIADLVRRTDRAAYVVTSDAAPGIDPESVAKLREAPAVGVVSMMGSDNATVDGHPDLVTALVPETAPSVLSLVAVGGDAHHLADGTALVTESAAAAGGFHVGQRVLFKFGEPQVRSLTIAAVIQDNGVTNDWVVSWNTYSIGYHIPTIRAAFIKGAAGADPLRLQREVDIGVAGFPGVEVKDAAAYSQSQAQRIDGPVALIDALVGLAVLIAVLWVVNTLALSVVERSADLRLLRLIGMTPGQLAASVRWEALTIAALGAVIGVAAGLVLGVALIEALRSQGITEVSVPVPAFAILVGLIIVAALLAAVFPARAAARMGRGGAAAIQVA